MDEVLGTLTFTVCIVVNQVYTAGCTRTSWLRKPVHKIHCLTYAQAMEEARKFRDANTQLSGLSLMAEWRCETSV